MARMNVVVTLLTSEKKTTKVYCSEGGKKASMLTITLEISKERDQ
jgi:hypothetical protein